MGSANQVMEMTGEAITSGSRVQFQSDDHLLELYSLSEPSDYTMSDNEFETMCMANGPVCNPQYNATLVGVDELVLPGYKGESVVRGWVSDSKTIEELVTKFSQRHELDEELVRHTYEEQNAFNDPPYAPEWYPLFEECLKENGFEYPN